MNYANPVEAGMPNPHEYDISYQAYELTPTDEAFCFLLHFREFFDKTCKCVNKAATYYQDSKEFYYTFCPPQITNVNYIVEPKTYEGTEIIKLKRIQLYSNEFDRLDMTDQLFLICLSLEDYLNNLYSKIDEAYEAYYQRREFYFIFKPLEDFFNIIETPNQTYSAEQIIMLNNYAKSLTRHDVPEPQYWYAKRVIIENSEESESEIANNLTFNDEQLSMINECIEMFNNISQTPDKTFTNEHIDMLSRCMELFS